MLRWLLLLAVYTAVQPQPVVADQGSTADTPENSHVIRQQLLSDSADERMPPELGADSGRNPDAEEQQSEVRLQNKITSRNEILFAADQLVAGAVDDTHFHVIRQGLQAAETADRQLALAAAERVLNSSQALPSQSRLHTSFQRKLLRAAVRSAQLADSGNIDVPARENGGRIEDQSAENTYFQHSSAAPHQIRVAGMKSMVDEETGNGIENRRSVSQLNLPIQPPNSRPLPEHNAERKEQNEYFEVPGQDNRRKPARPVISPSGRPQMSPGTWKPLAEIRPGLTPAGPGNTLEQGMHTPGTRPEQVLAQGNEDRWVTHARRFQLKLPRSKPVRFSDPDLEDRGQSYGVWQPLVSGLRFFGQVLLLPLDLCCLD
jgi:hypothetical protein